MIDEGNVLYNKFMAKAQEQLNYLKKSPNKKLYEVMSKFVSEVQKPEKMYSKDQCAKMAKEYDAFIAAHPMIADDDQIFQIMIGSVIDYKKYRNQYGAENELAGNIARKNKFGEWTEKFFIIQYESHKNDPRYNPEDCLKK